MTYRRFPTIGTIPERLDRDFGGQPKSAPKSLLATCTVAEGSLGIFSIFKLQGVCEVATVACAGQLKRFLVGIGAGIEIRHDSSNARIH